MSTPSLPLVAVAPEIPEAWTSRLHAHARVIPLSSIPADADAEVAGVLTILTMRVDESMLARFPKLRVVSNMAVGVDNIDLAACERRSVHVGNTPGVLTDATADIAMTLILSVTRRAFVASRDAREGRWGPWSPTGWLGASLRGKRLGVVGLGAIGRATATRARSFGMHICYSGPSRKLAAEAALDASWLPLTELLASADVVSLHCPLLEATHHLIDTIALRSMKPTSALINTARGDVVDQVALERALDEGWIGGAGLDVTTPEPLPPTHALYRRDDCLITPHIGSATVEARQNMATLACENLIAALEGAPLPHEVLA